MRPYDRSSPWAGAAMFAVAAIALGTFYYASYRDALHGFFVLDDYWVMSAASRIEIRSPLDVVQFGVPVPDFSLYRPLSTVGYFSFLREAWGYDPFAYHATHLAFHVLNALLAYGIAARLLGRANGLAA